jgi:hypothetical protein
VPEDDRESAEQFVSRMDAGDFDGKFSAQLENLSIALMEEILTILIERESHSGKPPR